MNFVEMMSEKDTYTANGAVTNSTSHNKCLDLFFLAGACRNEREEDITKLLISSYIQDRLTTLKIIFWAGDIRGGAGERRFFKIALKWLAQTHPNDIQNNIQLIPEFSRWDVLFELAMEHQIIFSFILSVLGGSMEDPRRALLCKWLPRKVKATDKHKVVKNKKVQMTVSKKRLLYGGIAGKIMKAMRLTPKQYRKMLVNGSKTVEQKMCAKQWNTIEYSKVPSVAMNKYNKAWYRNDEERFTQYIEDVNKGKSKINASVIFPHDIIKQYFTGTSEALTGAQITQWNNLPNYLGDAINSIIPVCDVSGSMQDNNYLPLSMSVALGLYISERNQGPFKDAFITFSEEPQMCYLKGNINERILQLQTTTWGFNTNVIKVFETILERAKETKAPQEMMPKTVLLISDMEFDQADESQTNFEYIDYLYKENGYQRPNIVFWNVNGRTGNVPVTKNDQGVALVSGASPSIIKSVLSNDLSPEKVMYDTINNERYLGIR